MEAERGEERDVVVEVVEAKEEERDWTTKNKERERKRQWKSGRER